MIKPAGFDNSQGIISAAYLKDASDPQWDNDAGMRQFLDFLAKDFQTPTAPTGTCSMAMPSLKPWSRC